MQTIVVVDLLEIIEHRVVWSMGEIQKFITGILKSEIKIKF